MSDTNWKNDNLQFMRLLAEIHASKLTTEQYKDLSESMDLSFDKIDELLQRATDAFEHLTSAEARKEAWKKKHCQYAEDENGVSYCIHCKALKK